MMVAMGHGLCVCLCVCGETTKNKEESKNRVYEAPDVAIISVLATHLISEILLVCFLCPVFYIR
jgi:hypothetical protein